jgi:ADP-ribose pyrophosphatase
VTLRRCEEAGLSVATLEAWRDVDTAIDLAFLLRAQGLQAPRTRRLLAELAASGTLAGDPPRLRPVSSELLSATRWRAVLDERLVTDDGRGEGYTYLAVPRAVFVVPVTTDGDLVLVRQYRHPVRDWTLEVPAGSVGEGESSLEAARRELREETGGTARAWRHLSTFYSSSAHISLRSDAWLATGVELTEPRHDLEERVTVVRMPLREAIARAEAGLFEEGQTALAILLAAPLLRKLRTTGRPPAVST